MQTIPLSEYKDAMRENVCRVCVSFMPERGNPNRCAMEIRGNCKLFAHLDEVVELVSGIDNVSIEPYVTALRNEVCAHCSHQNNRGICDLRDGRGPVPEWCVLDTYFNLIVGTIEEVQSGMPKTVRERL